MVILVGLRDYEALQRRSERNGTKLHISARLGAAFRNIRKLTENSSGYKEREQEVRSSGLEEEAVHPTKSSASVHFVETALFRSFKIFKLNCSNVN